METPYLDQDIDNMQILKSRDEPSHYGELKRLEFIEIKKKLNQLKQ